MGLRCRWIVSSGQILTNIDFDRHIRRHGQRWPVHRSVGDRDIRHSRSCTRLETGGLDRIGSVGQRAANRTLIRIVAQRESGSAMALHVNGNLQALQRIWIGSDYRHPDVVIPQPFGSDICRDGFAGMDVNGIGTGEIARSGEVSGWKSEDLPVRDRGQRVALRGLKGKQLVVASAQFGDELAIGAGGRLSRLLPAGISVTNFATIQLPLNTGLSFGAQGNLTRPTIRPSGTSFRVRSLCPGPAEVPARSPGDRQEAGLLSPARSSERWTFQPRRALALAQPHSVRSVRDRR